MADLHPKRNNKRNYCDMPTAIKATPGIVVRHEGTYAERYRGTRAAICAAGLVRDGMFPGDPGRPIGTVTYRPRNPDPRTPMWLTIAKRRAERFDVFVRLSEVEIERREAAHEACQAREGAGEVLALRVEQKAMSVLHCRKLPAGWRVIAGGAQPVALR